MGSENEVQKKQNDWKKNFMYKQIFCGQQLEHQLEYIKIAPEILKN